MTDLRKAAEMALEALEDAETNNDGEARWDLHRAATEALRQALAQQALADSIRPKGKSITKVWVDEINQALAQPQQAQTSGYAKKIESLIKERDELRKALAQPEQEPVAWLEYGGWGDLFVSNKRNGSFPVYKEPPSKPWVSLTSEELASIVVDHAGYPTIQLTAIEAALRSKNT